MPKSRIDCKKAEPDNDKHNPTCKWCGRPCKWTYAGKFVHRRGYKRIHDDPRIKEKIDA